MRDTDAERARATEVELLGGSRQQRTRKEPRERRQEGKRKGRNTRTSRQRKPTRQRERARRNKNTREERQRDSKRETKTCQTKSTEGKKDGGKEFIPRLSKGKWEKGEKVGRTKIASQIDRRGGGR